MKEHRKSRRGCVRCKQRKCDETLPSCKRCVQRRETCSFISEYGLDSSSSAHYAPYASSTPQPSQPDLTLHRIDLHLIHQYLTSTYSTLWGSEIGKQIWRDNVFQMASTTPTVLASLLATAVLHGIAETKASAPEVEDVALQKQTQVFDGLQRGLQNIHADNCDEVFVLSTLVSIWSFASRALPPRLNHLSVNEDATDGAGGSAIDQFVQLVRRLKPMRTVTRESRTWLRRGGLAGLLRPPRIEELPELSEDTRRALNALEYQLQQNMKFTSQSTGDLPAFTMEFMFRVRGRPDLCEMLIGWPVQLSEQIIEGIKERDDAALTLLAYWSVCFDAMNDRWWAEGWSRDLVGEISSNIVQGPWLELVTWCRVQLRI